MRERKREVPTPVAFSSTRRRQRVNCCADCRLPPTSCCPTALSAMDSRRLQELREVYTQLSQQSTGPDGAQADAAAAVPAPAGSSPALPPGQPTTTSGQHGDNTNNLNPGGLSQGLNPTQPPTPSPVPAGSGGSGASVSGGAASLPALNRGTSFMSDSEHDGAGSGGGGTGAGTAGKRKRKRSERNSFYPGSYFEWTDELMVSAVCRWRGKLLCRLLLRGRVLCTKPLRAAVGQSTQLVKPSRNTTL